MKIPKKFLTSKYRKEMWKNVNSIVSKISKVIPITKVYLGGSFATKKRRPADIDFFILLKTPKKSKARWSFDLVTAPDNKHGNRVAEDFAKWLKQKYGAKNSGFMRIK